MHFHINHMFCTDPSYNSRYMVVIQQEVYQKIGEVKTVLIQKDWKNLVYEAKFFDQRGYDIRKKLDEEKGKVFDEVNEKRWNMKFTFRLKRKALNWLKENVKDSPDKENGGGKGWWIASDAYNFRGYGDFNIWFYRRSDAMKFIKTFSIYKKPTTYFNYFDSIRKEYNFKTKTLQKVEEFTLR
jgi:hypothetical protein